jgi:hypothetical protein
MSSMSSSSLARVDCFSVLTTADPSALPRILEVFSVFGLVPSRCHSARDAAAEPQLVVDLQIEDLAPGEAERLARRLGRVVTVTQVLWSEKRQAAAV